MQNLKDISLVVADAEQNLNSQGGEGKFGKKKDRARPSTCPFSRGGECKTILSKGTHSLEGGRREL